MSSIEAIQAQIANLKTRAKILSSPVVKKLAQKYPDAEFNAYEHFVSIDIDLNQHKRELDPLFDISGLEGVTAGDYGYSYNKTLLERPYKIAGRTVDVRVRVCATQQFSDEEKDLLRSLGKIQTQMSKYESLVCGF
jgi:hypothetical protein